MDHQSKNYLVSSDGKIIFTQEGKKWLGKYFSRAGISLDSIKTYDDYLQARKDASPYFMDHMADHIASLPDKGEYALLKSVFFDSEEVYQEKVRLYNLKKSMKIVKGDKEA